MRTNQKAATTPVFTHEGAVAYPHLTAIQLLRRSVLSCLLWEDEFYEDGETIAQRIITTAGKCRPSEVAALAVEARHHYYLRHVPLLLCYTLTNTAPGTSLVSDTLANVIHRADELTEFLALYWKLDGRPSGSNKPPRLSAQVKKGLARAFGKFDEYALAKYNRDHSVKLWDVMKLVRPKPATTEQAALWGRLKAGKLFVPDTWETELSAGADKKATFERLITEGKLGYMAVLRNLRNMRQANVDRALIEGAILARKGSKYVLPFRFVAAARTNPELEPTLDQALCAHITERLVPFDTLTYILVDVSGSMDEKLSAKSDLTRMDAAATLASVIPAANLRVFTFSDRLVEVPPRRGFAGIDAIVRSQPHSGTKLGEAIAALHYHERPYSRLIIISDAQAHPWRRPYVRGGYSFGDAAAMPDPLPSTRGYMINVASARNGVGYGKWTNIDGFSENVLAYIREIEKPSDEEIKF